MVVVLYNHKEVACADFVVTVKDTATYSLIVEVGLLVAATNEDGTFKPSI